MTGVLTAAKNVFSKCKIKLRFEKTNNKQTDKQKTPKGGRELF